MKPTVRPPKALHDIIKEHKEFFPICKGKVTEKILMRLRQLDTYFYKNDFDKCWEDWMQQDKTLKKRL